MKHSLNESLKGFLEKEISKKQRELLRRLNFWERRYEKISREFDEIQKEFLAIEKLDNIKINLDGPKVEKRFRNNDKAKVIAQIKNILNGQQMTAKDIASVCGMGYGFVNNVLLSNNEFRKCGSTGSGKGRPAAIWTVNQQENDT